MKLLLDTHLLLWIAGRPDLLSERARTMVDDPASELWFSTVNIWEVAVKHSLGRQDFRADPRVLRRNLLDRRYSELTINSTHAIAVGSLPLIHKDPFDRMLIAQSIVEGITLLTSDSILVEYPAPAQLV